MAEAHLERVEVTSADGLEDWLAAHHGQAESVWLVTWKAAHPAKYVGREEVLDALIAWGWIDGRRKVLDADRTMQLIAPRRQQAWAQSYKDRAARLEAEGRMRPPGIAAVEAGKASCLWSFYDDVDALIVPHDLGAALAGRGAAEAWEAAPKAYRRNLLRWVKLAKTASTRSKRIAQITEAIAAGKRIPQM